MKLYKDPAEAEKHQRAIESLAAETHAPVEEVRSVYEGELEQIKAAARVEDFIPTLTHRRTRAQLKRRRR